LPLSNAPNGIFADVALLPLENVSNGIVLQPARQDDAAFGIGVDFVDLHAVADDPVIGAAKVDPGDAEDLGKRGHVRIAADELPQLGSRLGRVLQVVARADRSDSCA
jgi:hypothetical protein